jgi:hypothetical protein
VAVTFVGARRYVRRLIGPEHRGQRHAALILVLFAVMPAAWIVAWTNWGGNPRQYTFDFISGEMWSSQYLWGYLMTAIAVFLMPLTLSPTSAGGPDGRRRARSWSAGCSRGRARRSPSSSSPWRPGAGCAGASAARSAGPPPCSPA